VNILPIVIWVYSEEQLVQQILKLAHSVGQARVFQLRVDQGREVMNGERRPPADRHGPVDADMPFQGALDGADHSLRPLLLGDKVDCRR
jgi:hypothetical protein